MTNTTNTAFDNAEQNNAKENKTMETKQEQIDRENFETCKRIGDEIEKIASGDLTDIKGGKVKTKKIISVCDFHALDHWKENPVYM